ncbi:MAG TPA: hypothetical protein VIY30_14850, partial [Burkholderiaceae bacterium]
LLSSEPAAQLIDGFVTGVRRERAVVTTRNAHSATFVRFNAPDAKLVAMACSALASAGGQSLRFGFASGTKDRARAGHDAFSISSRYIAQANELAGAARPGEVLVTPKLALLLVESGFTFDARELRVASGRKVMACALDLPLAVPAGSTLDEPQMKASALGSVFQVLLAQAEEIARKQDELDARQDATLGKAALAETGTASRPAGLEGDLDAQIARLEARWAALDNIEQRIAQLEHKITWLVEQEVLVQTVKADLQFVSEHRNDVSELRAKVEDLLGRVHDTDGKIEMIESRRKMVEEVQARANGIIHMLQDINVNLEMLGEQRAVVDHVGEKLARLDFTVQEAHNTLRALQREREVAERIEQSIKALRAGANKTAPLHGEALTTASPDAKGA